MTNLNAEELRKLQAKKKLYSVDKIAFIQAVQQAANFYEAIAKNYAVDAISTNQKKDIDTAKTYVDRYKAQQELADKVIELIHNHLFQPES